ncbi:MAG TPA: PQQ-binding-like beta-propeller repeat protein [Ktedonobacteraceae bacterium]
MLDGVLYAASCNAAKLTSGYLNCYFHAFNAANGAELWHTPAPTPDGSLSQTDPVGSSSVIYYAGMSRVYAVDAHTGSILWTYTACTKNCSIGNLVATQHTLYIEIDSDSSSLLALNLAHRSVLWSKNVQPYSGEVWLLQQGLIYTSADQYHVKALDATSGVVLKSYTNGSEVINVFTLVLQAG